MTLTKKLAHNTASQIIGKAISVFLGLIALGMMTRYLGQEQFGWYITVMTFLQFIGILIDFGLIPVSAQMLSEPDHDKAILLKNLLGYRLATALLFLGAAPLVALFFPYPAPVKIAIAFSTINFVAVALNQVLIGFYQTKLKMHLNAFGEVVGRIALVVGLWYVIKQNGGFIPVMIIISVSSVFYTLALFWFAHKDADIGFSYNSIIWRAITKKMWPIAVAIMFNVVYLKGDILLLSLMRTQQEVGIYGAAYRVIDILSQTGMMLMGIMLPLLTYHWSRKQISEFTAFYQQSFTAMMLFAMPIVAGTILMAKPIMVLVAGNDFSQSGLPLMILSIAVLGVYIGAVFGHTAVAINKQKEVMWIYISNALITLIGYVIFIPLFGYLGAAGMTVFSELYAGILLFFFVRKHTGVKLNVVPFAKIVFSTITMSAVLLLLPEMSVLFSVLVGGGVYAFFIFNFGVVSKETMKELLK